jgi:hypothetical protein
VKDIVTGEWTSNAKKGSLRLDFADKPVRAYYNYTSIGKKRSQGAIINRTLGWWNEQFVRPGDSITDAIKKVPPRLGQFTAKTKVVQSMPVKASGEFLINPKTGWFVMKYEGKTYGVGLADNPEIFF